MLGKPRPECGKWHGPRAVITFSRQSLQLATLCVSLSTQRHSEWRMCVTVRIRRTSVIRQTSLRRRDLTRTKLSTTPLTGAVWRATRSVHGNCSSETTSLDGQRRQHYWYVCTRRLMNIYVSRLRLPIYSRTKPFTACLPVCSPLLTLH